eukprot:239037_1
MNSKKYQIKPPCINNIPIVKHKRNYYDLTGSSDTSPIKQDIHHDYNYITHKKKTNLSASHLPPLNKKRKIISASVNTIRLGTKNVQITSSSSPQYRPSFTPNIAPLSSNMCILPVSISPNVNTKLLSNRKLSFVSNLNVNGTNNDHSNVNLDTLISQVSNLPTINANQIQLLKQLILCSSNTNISNQNSTIQRRTNATHIQMPKAHLNNLHTTHIQMPMFRK